MGTYFNPDGKSFVQAVRSKVYVDKTEMLEELNRMLHTEDKCLAVSHARRFGKTQAARMVDAYYSRGADSMELFSKLKISRKADFTEHLNKYNVIHVDVSSFADRFKDNLVDKIWENLYREMEEECGQILESEQTIGAVLMDVYRKTDRPFVIILDEWDCVVRNHSDRPDLVHKYLQFLHSLFKSEESAHFLALAYITGILPVKKIKDESALNNFIEYTMVNSYELTPYFGFNEEEVQTLCEQYHMDFASVKEWYNGYKINGMHMYNPNSVSKAMTKGALESYWKNTSSFETINDLISMNFDGLKEAILTIVEGGRVPVDVEGFKNDLTGIATKDDALTALIHFGYLAYDAEMQEAYMPNFEVKQAYRQALKSGSWKEIADTLNKCNEILTATIRKEGAKVAEMLEAAHETYTSVLKYNDENSLSCAITMAYFTAPAYYTVVRELPAGMGFADIALIPRREAGSRPAMILELKWDQTADTAIKQIKENRYNGALAGCGREVLLVGVSYDKAAEGESRKKHHCVIEEVAL